MASPLIQQGTPAFTRAVAALFCAGFATFALLYCVQPLLPLFARHFGVSAASSSLALSLSTLSLACCMLLSATLAEVWGRKRLMLAALAAASMAVLLCALAQSWLALLALRVLLGVALSGLPALAMAYISEEFEKAALPSAMGLYISGSGLGGMLGRMLAGLLADWGGWHAAMLGIGLLGGAALLLFGWLLPASRNFQAQPPELGRLLGNFARHLANPSLRRLYLQGFLLMGCFVALFNYMGFHLEAPPFSLSPGLVSLVFTAYVGGIFSAGWAARLSRRIGPGNALAAAIGLMLLATLLCALPWLPLLVLGLGLFATAFFAAHSIVSSQVGSQAQTARAQASALYLGFYYLGSSVVGYVAGYLLQHGGWLSMLALLGLLLLTAASIARRI